MFRNSLWLKKIISRNLKLIMLINMASLYNIAHHYTIQYYTILVKITTTIRMLNLLNINPKRKPGFAFSSKTGGGAYLAYLGTWVNLSIISC